MLSTRYTIRRKLYLFSHSNDSNQKYLQFTIWEPVDLQACAHSFLCTSQVVHWLKGEEVDPFDPTSTSVRTKRWWLLGGFCIFPFASDLGFELDANGHWPLAKLPGPSHLQSPKDLIKALTKDQKAKTRWRQLNDTHTWRAIRATRNGGFWTAWRFPLRRI